MRHSKSKQQKPCPAIWDILTKQSWTFSKELPENGVLIQGKARLTPVEEKPNHVKWHEQGSWQDVHGKSYACSLTHEYVREDNRILIYSGPDTKTLLHDFSLKTFYEFPFAMQHTHLCGQDSYACEWIFLSEKTFKIAYQVLGPKKNYRIWAQYIAIEKEELNS